MARVIIVSRTRMAGDCVCVGGVDIDNRCSLRLLDVRGHHETADKCPYQIWDIWDIDYYLIHGRPNPHSEDANVTRRERIRTADPSNLPVERLAAFLEKSNIPLFRGSLFTVFDGKLRPTDNDKLYISKEDVPHYSTCFWINDKRLLGYTNSRERWQYRYHDISNQYGYTISYVGTAEPPATIEPGSLIRLSLAHWWKPDDSDDEERCYLQLSGCLIEGHVDAESAEQAHSETFIPSEDHLTLPVKEALKGISCKLTRATKNYAGTNIPKLSLSLSKTFQGQEELTLTKEVFDAIFDLLKDCVVSFDEETGKYVITLPKTGKAIYPNAYSPWSDEDDRQLKRLFDEGKSIEELMTIFQRNRGSITSRLRKIGATE